MQFSWSRAAVVVAAAPLVLLGLAVMPASAHQQHSSEHALPRHTNPAAAIISSEDVAGYVASGAAQSFTSVEATFVLPRVTCTGDGAASFWVGLDGDSSSTVEQIGVAAECEGTTPYYYSWWDMYPAAVNVLSNNTVPGDVYQARVIYDGGGNYTLSLQDNTEGWAVTEHGTSTSAQNSSAEVMFQSPAPDPVPRFLPVTMTSCTVNGVSLASESPQAFDLVRNGDTLVTPGPISPSGSFTFTWHAAN